jgi:hypothetical protein
MSKDKCRLSKKIKNIRKKVAREFICISYLTLFIHIQSNVVILQLKK